MAIFNCKICGGALNIDGAQTVAVCEYCGTKQTLPKLDDEKRATLYERANHFRRNNEFDKAAEIFNKILNEDPSDAESYWSIVLCRYGIEYVEDPDTFKRVPTVNRAQFTSIFDDEDYKSAIKYADGYQRAIYEEEANAINEIQKGILAISQKEEPFDVFICYKETDANGRRTQDSVLATELYHELTREGFKVFFSRITLEDKLGVAYEPYIFAALNSSKVMVVLGTKPAHFEAVWVKNEWSRYLSLIKNGARKTLIPAYRGMDPYDLPEEFSHLQAQDMSKLGFMQDLTRGIKKLLGADAPKAQVKETVTVAQSVNIAPLLKRAFMFLEDGEFDRADSFAEQILNQDPENAQAYLVKLLAELKLSKKEALAELSEPFDNNANYLKIARFDSKGLGQELGGYIELINKRKEDARLQGIYDHAMRLTEHPESPVYLQNLKQAISIMESISGFKDADEKKIEFEETFEKATEEAKYIQNQKIYLAAADEQQQNYIYNVRHAIKLYEKIIDFKDSRQQIENCKIKLERIRAEIEIAEQEKEKQRKIKAKKEKKIAIIIASVFVALVVAIIIIAIVSSSIYKSQTYNDAVDLMEDGKYEEAISAFQNIENYKDSQSKILECKYAVAIGLMETGKYEAAYARFDTLDGYKDSEEKIAIIRKTVMDSVSDYHETGKYAEAYDKMIAVGCTTSDFALLDAYREVKDENYKGAVEKGLVDFVVPYGTKNIFYDMFKNCKNLKSISIPSSVIIIGDSAFMNCTSLTNVTISSSVTNIGDFAFYSCTGLTSISIPNSVTSIGDHAFGNCTNLTNITIPNSVTSIGDSAFGNCANLKSIAVPNGVTSIEHSTFSDCTSLTSITIPDGVTSIGSYAFSDCTGLTSITIPNSVTSIGDSAFYGCTDLTSVTIPNSVTRIAYGAFEGCTSLASITIPNSVTRIEYEAFRGCTSLTNIIFEGTETEWNGIYKYSNWDLGTGSYTVSFTN